jgi:hypothetical protein
MSDLWNAILDLRRWAAGPGGTGSEGDTLLKLLDGWDFTAAKGTISGLVRSLGFGPEADGIATVILGLFIFLVIIGYAAGPSNKSGGSSDGSGGQGGAGSGTVGTEGPDKNK